MNKIGQSANLSGWSGIAVSVGMAGFMAFSGNTGWAWFFGLLAILLAFLGHK